MEHYTAVASMETSIYLFRGLCRFNPTPSWHFLGY